MGVSEWGGARWAAGLVAHVCLWCARMRVGRHVLVGASGPHAHGLRARPAPPPRWRADWCDGRAGAARAGRWRMLGDASGACVHGARVRTQGRRLRPRWHAGRQA
eukprot:6199286-Pleurochrysis_carterae.AAC.1